MPSSLLGKSVPIEGGGGGLCGLSIACPSPQDTRRQRHRKQNDPKFITIPSNQTIFFLSRCVSLSVGSWSQGPKVELHLLAPLSQWTKSTARPKLQIQILAVACAVLRHAAFVFPTWNYQEPTAGQRLDFRRGNRPVAVSLRWLALWR